MISSAPPRKVLSGEPWTLAEVTDAHAVGLRPPYGNEAPPCDPREGFVWVWVDTLFREKPSEGGYVEFRPHDLALGSYRCQMAESLE